MKIKTLNQDTINKIAAGEVIIRPASIVKELVENSIDANSKHITIKIQEGGKKEIIISDDGCGINYDEIPLAFKRHATSKINYISDLDNLETMGFRGEALSSIAAVANVKITSRSNEEELGSQTYFENGVITNRRVCPYDKGTEIIVSDLFSDIPARLKFLKKDETEERAIRDIVEKLALAHSDISFLYINNGRKVFQTYGNGSIKDTAQQIFGSSFSKHLHDFKIENLPMKISGLIGDLDARRTYRDNQIFFINGRYVKNKLLSQAYEEEWEGKLMKHQYPSGIIFLELPPNMLDVNVHPQKTEVRILNKSLILILFKQCIREVLDKLNIIPETLDEENESRDDLPHLKELPRQETMIQRTFEIPKIEKESTQEKKEEYFKTQTVSNFDNYEPNSSYQKNFIDSSKREFNYSSNNSESKNLNQSFSNKEDLQNQDRKIDFTELKLIGVIFNTYIIIEDEGYIYIIDQHAAHEAILYELFSEAFKKETGFESQVLFTPIKIDLTKKEAIEFTKVKDKLFKFGFQAELIDDCLNVSAVPIILNKIQSADLIVPMLNYFSKTSEYLPDYGLQDIIMASCKSAIKGGNELSIQEVQFLLEKLSELKNPFTCPHGRPIIRKQTEYELEKLFKRIV